MTEPRLPSKAQQLLDSTSGVEGVANFNFQVLRLGTYDGIEREQADFPNFTPEAPASMRQEVLHFLEWAFTTEQGWAPTTRHLSVSSTQLWRQFTG